MDGKIRSGKNKNLSEAPQDENISAIWTLGKKKKQVKNKVKTLYNNVLILN